MARIAGDSPFYQFRLCRVTNGFATPTTHGFSYPSVTSIIKDVIGVPAQAMSWYGFRLGLAGLASVLNTGDPTDILACSSQEDIEALLKAAGVSPNMSLEEAGGRGNSAHFVLEMLANGWNAPHRDQIVNPVTFSPDAASFREVAEAHAMDEALWRGTDYGNAVISFWDEQIQPFIDDGSIINVLSEVPVWSHVHKFAGSFDLAILWAPGGDILPEYEGGWEIIDLKTHKPARGFTKPGQGPAYISDALQIRTYRQGFEECGLGQTIGQRAVIARDNGKWLEDNREVPFALFMAVREAYAHKQRFEKGEEA